MADPGEANPGLRVKASGSEAKGHPEHDVVPDSGFMSRPSVAGFLLSPPGTAEAEEAGARGKRVSRRSPLGFLPRFF